MKFMKLGTKPDTFFTTESIRMVPSEVPTDIKIQVQNTLYLLHKFPLLSKCRRLRTFCSEPAIVHQLSDVPGGAEAFEICTKFCYGITVTLSALNFVPVRCAADYLQMNDDVDRSGNLIGKLEIFFKSCILRRWKDALLTLQSTRQHAALCEEISITGRCIDALAAAICSNFSQDRAEDISELGIDHYWRVMVAVRSAGIVSGEAIGEALQVYVCRWLPNLQSGKKIRNENRLLVEKIVSLLPAEKGSVSCSFLLRVLKAANILNASESSKRELVRRAGVQLEEASVGDLLIPSSCNTNLYDVDVVMSMVEEFMVQLGESPPNSPKLGGYYDKKRSRSAKNVEFEGQENRRRSSSASHGSKLRVAKLIDCYLQEVAGDASLPVEKLIALAKAVPDFARPDHDDLYRVIDIYLRAHPDVDKSTRKQLCQIMDCKKLSLEACMHAARNEVLPLRVVVQVLFFEHARAATCGGPVSELPNNIKALLATTSSMDEHKDATKLWHMGTRPNFDEEWSIQDQNCPRIKLETLRMKLAEADDDIDDSVLHHGGLMRSSSSRLRALCSIPSKPKKLLSKLWSLNRSVRERY